MDQFELRQINALLFTPEGDFSKLMKTCIAHFKDRFREQVKVATKHLMHNVPSTPAKVEQHLDFRGGIITLRATFPVEKDEADCWEAVQPHRLLTPTMRKAWFRTFRGDCHGSPGLEELNNSACGSVGMSFLHTGTREEDNAATVMTASMVFHHPSDRYYLPDEDVTFPVDVVTLSDGGKAWFRNQHEYLVLKSPRYLLAKGREQLSAFGEHCPETKAKAEMLWEAAQSPNATFGSLKSLMDRLCGSYQDFSSQKGPEVEAHAEEATRLLAAWLMDQPQHTAFSGFRPSNFNGHDAQGYLTTAGGTRRSPYNLTVRFEIDPLHRPDTFPCGYITMTGDYRGRLPGYTKLVRSEVSFAPVSQDLDLSAEDAPRKLADLAIPYLQQALEEYTLQMEANLESEGQVSALIEMFTD
jgi:hypothetical protein